MASDLICMRFSLCLKSIETFNRSRTTYLYSKVECKHSQYAKSVGTCSSYQMLMAVKFLVPFWREFDGKWSTHGRLIFFRFKPWMFLPKLGIECLLVSIITIIVIITILASDRSVQTKIVTEQTHFLHERKLFHSSKKHPSLPTFSFTFPTKEICHNRCPGQMTDRL